MRCLRTLVSIVALSVALAAAAQAQPPGGPSPVVVSPILQREVSSGQTFVGTVMPLKRAAVGSAVDGRVVEFPVKDGDRVEEGQTLAQLLTETIKFQVLAAEGELDLRREELQELENGSLPEEIAQAEAKMLASQASMENLESKYARTESLYKQRSAVTAEQVEEARSLAVAARQLYLEHKAAYELAVQGPRKERKLQAAARVKAQEALVNQLKDQYKKHTIISRFAGYVVAEHTEIGQWVSRGDLVAEVVALDEVDVLAHVLEKHVPHIGVGMSARVEIPALPHEAFTGRVAIIVPQADVRARTFPIKVRLQNPPDPSGEGIPLIKAGMLARVTLPTGADEDALLVPKDALVLGGAQPALYVVDRDDKEPMQGKVRPVPVELGVASGKLIQVKGSIKPGQHVVILGNERLRPEQAVQITRIVTPETEQPTAAK
jgi:RND family efflux transporter MFP subunit